MELILFAHRLNVLSVLIVRINIKVTAGIVEQSALNVVVKEVMAVKCRIICCKREAEYRAWRSGELWTFDVCFEHAWKFKNAIKLIYL
jgi:hypothetical protein